MHTFGIAQQGTFAVLDVYAVDVRLQRRLLGAKDDNLFLFLIESQHLLHKPIAAGQRFQFALLVHQVEVVVSILFALIDKMCFVPRQEDDGVFRLHIFGMRLFVECSYQFTTFGCIFAQLGVILVAVHFDKEKTLFVRAPTDVSEIAVGGVACL